MYTKPVYYASANVQKGWTEKKTDRQISILIMKGMYMDRTILRNVHGQNITKVQQLYIRRGDLLDIAI